MATNSNILAWRISWTEEPGGPLSTGSQRVAHDWSNLACMHAVICAQRMGTIKDRNGMDLTEADRKSTRLNSSHSTVSRMPSSA